MSARKVVVCLSSGDREALAGVVRRGSHPVGVVRRARILLELDQGEGGPVASYEAIAARVGVHVNTVARVAAAWDARVGDVLAVAGRKQRERPPVEPRLTGEVEARIIAMACGDAPDGYGRWSLRLLEKRVKLDPGLPDLDHSTIGRALKKTGFTLT